MYDVTIAVLSVARAVDGTTTRIGCEAVLAVAEAVSPSTLSMDRAVKPGMYAEAGIPVYWQVELRPVPAVVVQSLRRGRYATLTTLAAGQRGRVTRPFPVELDPAGLTRRTA